MTYRARNGEHAITLLSLRTWSVVTLTIALLYCPSFARAQKEWADEDVELVTKLYYEALAHKGAGKVAEEELAWQRLVTVTDSIGQPEFLLTRVYPHLAYYYNHNHRLEALIQTGREALDYLDVHRESLTQSHVDSLEIDLTVRLAHAHDRIGNPSERKRLVEKAIKQYENAELDILPLLADLNDRLSSIYSEAGEYEIARDYALIAAEQYARLAPTDDLSVGSEGHSVKRAAANSYLLGETSLATELYERAIENLTAAYPLPDTMASRNRIITALISYGLLLVETDNYDRGMQTMRRALTYAAEGSSLMENIYRELGRAATIGNDFATAGTYFRQSLAANTYGANDFHRAQTLIGLGELAERQGLNENALMYYQDALKELVSDYNPSEPCDLPKLSGIIYEPTVLLQGLGAYAGALWNSSAAADRDRLACAQGAYSLAIAVHNERKEAAITENARRRIIEENYELFSGAIEIAIARGDIDYALRLAERSKANALLSAVLAANVSEGLLPDSVRLRELSLRYELRKIEEQQYDKTSKDQTGTDEQSLVLARRALLDFYATLRDDYPAYFQLLRGDSLVERSASIDPPGNERAVINFFVGEKGAYGIVLQAQSAPFVYAIELSERALSRQIDSLVTAIYARHAKEASAGVNNFDADYSRLAHQLYLQLLSPAVEQFSPDVTELLIIPHGVLAYLPFSALLSRPGPTVGPYIYSNTGDYQYLVRDFSMSYAYSATLQRLMSEPRADPDSRGLVVFHDLDFNAQPASIQRAFTELGFDQDYVEVLGQESTIGVLERKGKDYAMIHFAVHGIVNSLRPNQSYLRLRGGGSGDSSLYLSKIYSLDLPADLVFTSSCNAGVGRLVKGEGPLSLAQGFAHAGAKSLITTLWEVEGGPTDRLMQTFYASLGQGEGKPVALRKAQLELVNSEYADPYYWAGLIAIGDTAPVVDRAHPTWLFLLGACVVIGGFLAYRYRTRSRNSATTNLTSASLS